MRTILPQRAHLLRLSLVRTLVLLVWIVFAARLLQIQWDRALYLEEAEEQHKCRLSLQAERGLIFDRKQRVLAANLLSRSLAANPLAVTRPEEIADSLASVVGDNRETFLGRLQAKRSFVWLVRHASDSAVRRAESLNVPGIFQLTEMKRWYPLGCLLGQVLGYTDTDTKGIEGIEYGLNAHLQGEPGFAISQRDAKGRLHPELHSVRVPPRDGNDVYLTIDATYQAIAEEELAAAVKQFDAAGGVVLLMDPRSAEVLALAHHPFCDPNRPAKYQARFRKNKAITDVYEPGSTFKVVAAAAAIERGLVALEDSIFCENGSMLVAGRPMRDAHKYGWLTFREVVAHSSNIGMAKVAQRVGRADMYHYIRDFGFGSKTGIQLPGEVEGILHHPAKWSRRSLASLAMGQEISVTALQLANAYCAIANGGRLMRPFAVEKVVSKDGRVLKETKPLFVRRVVSDNTARIITQALVEAVEYGTGAKARIGGVTVAGKTGTAQKPRRDGPGYAPGEYVSSFVGFLPADAPQLLCLVIVDTPRGLHWASETAAPTFAKITGRLMSLKSNPIGKHQKPIPVSQRPQKEAQVIVPNVRGYLAYDAERLLAGYGLVAVTRSHGRHVSQQSVPPGRWVKPGTLVALELEESQAESASAPCTVPDVCGLSLRRAVAILAASGFDVRVRGTGLVASQNPAQGTTVSRGARCVLKGDRSRCMRLSALE